MATLGELAERLRAHNISVEIRGDSQCVIESVAPLEAAAPGQISFLSNPKYHKFLEDTQATAVVVGKDVEAPARLNLLRVPDPYFAITVLIISLHGYRRHPGGGIDPQARIDPSAEIGSNANIMQFVTVGRNVRIGRNVTLYPGCYIARDCRLGDDVVLYPNVVLYEGCVLGSRVAIHAGTVVANDGLGYAPHEGKWFKIPQIGHVEIGDDVEIGANCAIDRAAVGKTVIGSGTKFSNLIAIGHGAKIGPRCMFVAQVGIAGSTVVGEHVTMAGQAGVVGHVTIGDNATVAAQAGVSNDVEAGATVLGTPATDIADMRRQYASMGKLPQMRTALRQLQKEVRELRARIDESQPK